jgi:hypothetical protein
MPTAASFWKFIETRPSRTAVAAEWRVVADAGLPVVQGLLAPMDALAEYYPNLRPGHIGRYMRIVRHGDGSIIAVDEQDYQNRLKLGHDDVVLHRVDLHKLRKSVADALDGVRISRAPIDEGHATLHVGIWEPRKGKGFPVYLLLCGHPRRLREELLRLASRKDEGAILLTPTRNCWGEGLRRAGQAMEDAASAAERSVDAGCGGIPGQWRMGGVPAVICPDDQGESARKSSPEPAESKAG